MDSEEEVNRFRNLRFEDFSQMAGDDSLKPHEKIGFPSMFREGFDQAIYADIISKIPSMHKQGGRIVDIGCGCGELALLLIKHCTEKKQKMFLVDSQEVLDQLPSGPGITKITGKFPENESAVSAAACPADAIICYSVFHYIIEQSDPQHFISALIRMLGPGGRLLLGDVPNVSRRNRFLATPEGIAFHQRLNKTDQKPAVPSEEAEPRRMGDEYILGLLKYFRGQGVESFVLPQPDILPLSNSREDILFVKY